MADPKETRIQRIVNKATGIVWEVVEGSATHKRCQANPKQYEFLAPGQDEAKAPAVVPPVGAPPAAKKGKANGGL